MSQHPPWTKVRVREKRSDRLAKLLNRKKQTTVCEEAQCPNLPSCWGRGTATIMVLGSICTRGCTYCSIQKGKPFPPDRNEPREVAEAVREAGWNYVVLTMVDRDDLPDGGADHIAETVERIKGLDPPPFVEVLVGDFRGREEEPMKIVHAGVDVFAHNIETVRRLYPHRRPQGDYQGALDLLDRVSQEGIRTKSSLVAGMGEEWGEVMELLDDLRDVGVWAFTAGQYLQPTPREIAVVRHYKPSWFKSLEESAKERGMRALCGPLVRSSYRAEKLAGLETPRTPN
ncbi:lipoyl synthase [bacterium]|nr:lipoyl synthase [bacterium]